MIASYFTGYLLEKIFHVKYWDYTYEPFNVNGYICLGCSLAWGVLALLLVRIIHNPVEKFLLGIHNLWLIVIDIIFIVMFVGDVVVSAKQAFDLRKIIDEKIMQNENVIRLQKRLDVLIAFANDDKEKIQEKLEDGRAEMARIKEELSEAVEKYNARIEKYKKNAKRIIKRNPNTVSKKHRLEFDEIKEWLQKK